MDRDEARALLAGILSEYRGRSYADLRKLVGTIDTPELVGSSGTEYGVEVQFMWDSSREATAIRVAGLIDDGRFLSGLRPVCDDFLVFPPEHDEGRPAAARVIDLIELHDSVAELRREENAVVLLLRPAYVHHWENSGAGWIGTGRAQDARMEIDCETGSVAPLGSSQVSDGNLRVADSQFDLIPAPLDSAGEVCAHLELTDGTSVTVVGTRVRVELLGPSTDIEPLPAEWAPDVGAG